MRFGRLACQLLLGFAWLTVSAWAEPALFFGGALRAELPTDLLRQLDDDAVQTMFASSVNPPGVVLVTPDAETRISMTHTSTPITLEDLDDIRLHLRQRTEATTEVRWVRDEMIQMRQQPWFRLDYDLTNPAIGRREILMGTALRGQLFYLVVALPLDDLEFQKEDIESFLGSLETLPPSTPETPEASGPDSDP